MVYNSVGRDTFPGSLDCLKPLGMWVLFGQSSGTIQDFDLNMLAQKGSLFSTRPTLFTYAAKREALETMAAELMDVVGEGDREGGGEPGVPARQGRRRASRARGPADDRRDGAGAVGVD